MTDYKAALQKLTDKTPGFIKIAILPFLVSSFFALLAITGVFTGIDGGLYDIFLRIKPAPAQWDKILLVDIDDKSINDMGEFPWPRNLMADQILTLAELGAGYAVFDIEYINKSQQGLNKSYLDTTLSKDVTSMFTDLQSGILDLYGSLADGRSKLWESQDYFQQLADYAGDIKSMIFSSIEKLAIDSDDYFGKSLRFFGDSYLTLNFGQGSSLLRLEDTTINMDSDKIAAERDSLKNLVVEGNVIPEAPMLLTPYSKIFGRAKGAGFVDVEIDPDGKRRRIYLLRPYQGAWYAQLGFAPLLDYYGNPTVKVRADSIVLEGVKEAGKPDRTIRIPLDSGGHMLINWPKEEYVESFKPHLPVHTLWITRKFETDIYKNLVIIAQALAQGKAQAEGLIAEYEAIEAQRDSMLEAYSTDPFDRGALGEYRGMKEAWIARIGSFLDSDVLATNLGSAAALKENPKLREIERAAVDKKLAELPEDFAALAKSHESYVATRGEIKDIVAGKICILGWTGTGTTDIGVNSFHSKYVNVGTHASIINTIQQGDFLTEAPVFLPPLLTIALSLALILAVRRLRSALQNLFSVAAILGFAALDLLLFVATGIYLPPLSIFLALFFSFIGHSIQRFLGTERDKTFLRKAFSTYLSDEVIEKIVSDPKSLKLGGDERHMTAIFTDVKGFSTLSENLDPVSLVHLLNDYLGSMSDIVLDEKGTIDKYEGDAIIAFYNAPLDLPAHAAAACRSALRMKRKEAELNQIYLAEKLSPVPLLTRIGINTGRMVVGNMGTERKMNYTIMGNSVNLAARLEGVNKRYGTWILTSATTSQEAGGEFLFRPLDRVRVVGIFEPIRLHEVVGFASEADQALRDKLGLFVDALALFEKQEWAASIAGFAKVLALDPEDGPSKYYTRVAGDFIAQAPHKDWDGVFNLTEK